MGKEKQNKIKRFFEQIDYFFSYHKELDCKHCCIGCKFYDDCFEDTFYEREVERSLNE